MRLSADACTADHPRGCGEHSSTIWHKLTKKGSSPRMRGALTLMPRLTGSGRIIPADAGSTPCGAVRRPPAADHPRGCGEHGVHRPALIYIPGSSPRMRGAHSANHLCGQLTGIIPADAGSTCRQSERLSGAWDHPRGCGEHQLGLVHGHTCGGSSPRMRGALAHVGGGFAVVRIIPADAGSTLKDHCNPNTMIDKISDFK